MVMLQVCRRAQTCIRQRHPSSNLTLSGRFRCFHTSPALAVVKPFILADIGEGIKEVQIIQWFVEPGARVEQFDKLCEVQSDKAVTEITSRFDGIIKKLYYERDDNAQVGKPLCDIDIQGEIPEEADALLMPPTMQAGEPSDTHQPQNAVSQAAWAGQLHSSLRGGVLHSGKHGSLATPAVRGLLKELDVTIEEVVGTGKGGRVLKEDVHRFAAGRDSLKPSSTGGSEPIVSDDGPQRESSMSLTPNQSQMFKAMTRSLSIPHFVYADEIDLSGLSFLRTRLNSHPSAMQKLSYLSFVIKAVSVALHDFPLLNCRLELEPSNSNTAPKLIMREKHNIGIAIDCPQGLMVPNIKNVAALSILDIAQHIIRLQMLAQASKLSATDLTGGTITVSNIGSIGGTYVSPVIVQSEVAILGMGRAKVVPAFDANGEVVRKTVGNFSWSADHRIIDGATMARMGERVKVLLEEPALLLAVLR